MEATTTRASQTVPGPWGCTYTVNTNTVVVNVAQAIHVPLTEMSVQHRGFDATVPPASVVTLESCKAAWAAHADTHREAAAVSDRRCSIFGLWVRLIDAAPLDTSEWERVRALVARQVEWNDTLDGDAPLGDLYDGQN